MYIGVKASAVLATVYLVSVSVFSHRDFVRHRLSMFPDDSLLLRESVTCKKSLRDKLGSSVTIVDRNLKLANKISFSTA